VNHHVPVVAVCQEDPLVARDAEDGGVAGHGAEGHVEAVDNGKMEAVDDGSEDAYDCLFQGMYGYRGNDYHA